jgi:hypothetical protein
MRRILFVVALLAALAPTAGPASAQIAPISQFSGYSTGTAVHVDALQNGANRLLDTEVAFSGANVNSGGLKAALVNEMDQAYQQATAEPDMAAGRGSGLEAGVATVTPNVNGANQVNPGSTVQAFAPASTGLLTANLTTLNLDPIVNSELLRGQAQAVYSDSVCVLGQPISSGLGYAGDAALVGTPTAEMIASNTGANALSQSKSFTYLVPNSDGTYGLVTETHQILAPITIVPAVAGVGGLQIEFGGEWVLRSTATGKPGGSTVEYAPVGAATPTTKVIRVMAGTTELASITLQQILDKDGFVLTLPAPFTGVISIGAPPRAIGGSPTSTPELLANGTKAAAAVDVAQITAELAGLTIADLRVGHMESMAMVPVGGIQCGIPVKKVGSPASVVAGQDQTVNYTITIPADVEAFKAIACDVMNIKVVDVTTAEPGVLFNIVSASRDGKIDGNTVTWENLGTYKPGDPPIVLNVGLKVPAGSAAGKITDTATATAVLGNCTGNASATKASLAGLAKLDTAALSGSGVAFSGSTTTVAGAAVVAPATGATPVGGVQTGFGGTSHSTNRVVPIATALGSIALVGSLTAWRRRRNG